MCCVSEYVRKCVSAYFSLISGGNSCLLTLSNYRQVLFDARVTFLKNVALIEHKIPV